MGLRRNSVACDRGRMHFSPRLVIPAPDDPVQLRDRLRVASGQVPVPHRTPVGGEQDETGVALPGGIVSVYAIRLGIEPFAELGANSMSFSGAEVDSSCSRRTILGLAPVTVLQSRFKALGRALRNPI